MARLVADLHDLCIEQVFGGHEPWFGLAAHLPATPRTVHHPHDLEQRGDGGLPPIAEQERELSGPRHHLGDQPRRVLLGTRSEIDPQEEPAPHRQSCMDPFHLFRSQFGMRLVQRHTGHVDVPDHLRVMGLGTLGRHPLEAIHGLEIDCTDVGGPFVTDAPALALEQPLHGVFGQLAAGHQRPFALRELVSTRGAAKGRRWPTREPLRPSIGGSVHRVAEHFMLMAHCQSNLNLTPWPRAIGVAPEGRVMSQFSKMKHSRTQWKEKAKQRGQGERYERREKARMKAERDRLTHALKASEARVHSLEAQLNGLATRPKVDGVYLALQLFLEARLSFRAVSRVLAWLAWALGLQKAPCPQTIINWVIRLTLVRIDAARTVRGLPLEQAPFTNGLLWMIAISIGLGSGKIVAVLALDAHHHQLVQGAPALRHVHCVGVAVGDSWTGETIAELLKRLIAQMGRPAAYLKDGGSDLQKAAALLEDDGLGSPCLDDISHAAAGMINRTYQSQPAFERFVSACGRASGKLKHTLLACLVPPTVRTKARFMHVHRFVTWADRVLQLS